MTTAILEIVILGLKLIFMIVNSIMKYNAEEQRRFEERIKTLSSALKAAIENREESLNEEAYLSNLEWEKKQRYQTYKSKFIEVLYLGGGISELLNVSDLAMGARVSEKKNLVIEILLKDLSVDEKSKQFAKLLSE